LLTENSALKASLGGMGEWSFCYGLSATLERMCFLAKMPTKAKPVSTSKPSLADKAAWQSVIDAAPDGEAAHDEPWDRAIVTQGGGVTDTLTELRRARGQRGPQKKPRKTATAIRLSSEVTEFFKASGPGWQTRIDEALREYVKDHKPG